MGLFDSPQTNRRRLRIIAAFLFLLFVAWAARHPSGTPDTFDDFRKEAIGLTSLIAGIGLWKGRRGAVIWVLVWSVLVESQVLFPPPPADQIDWVYDLPLLLLGLAILVALNIAIHKSLPAQQTAS
jgi:hypothetical protein